MCELLPVTIITRDVVRFLTSGMAANASAVAAEPSPSFAL